MVDGATSDQGGTVEVSLARLVAALPEIYQPIFAHPELSGQVSRRCDDRLSHIVQIHAGLRAKLDRPLRGLDLGAVATGLRRRHSGHGGSLPGLSGAAQPLAQPRHAIRRPDAASITHLSTRPHERRAQPRR
jgi:hypothetical protein